jgi:hypothetical protein
MTRVIARNQALGQITCCDSQAVPLPIGVKSDAQSPWYDRHYIKLQHVHEIGVVGTLRIYS